MSVKISKSIVHKCPLYNVSTNSNFCRTTCSRNEATAPGLHQCNTGDLGVVDIKQRQLSKLEAAYDKVSSFIVSEKARQHAELQDSLAKQARLLNQVLKKKQEINNL